MRTLIALSLLMLLPTWALAGPFEGSDPYRAQLESLGYTVKDAGKTLLAEHPQNLDISVGSIRGGIQIVGLFGTSEKGKQDRLGLLKFLNGRNGGPVGPRFYVDQNDDIVVEDWYPGSYDKARFGLFLDKYNVAAEQMIKSDAAADFLE